MSPDQASGVAPPPVAVHLLDSVMGRPVQSWHFESKACVSIGRGDTQDVNLTDPYVSRTHAEIRFQNGAWILFSRGRNGVVVSNQMITEYAVEGEVNFRLGPNGPSLRFQPTVAAPDAPATLSFDS